MMTSRFFLGLVLALAAVAAGRAGAPAGPAPSPSAVAGVIFTPFPDARDAEPVLLDPATLADRPAPAVLARPGDARWDISADGSTLVGLERDPAGGVTVIVRDAQSGAERARFRPPEDAAESRLTTDGARLVMQAPTTPPTWYVLSTADGRLLATVRGEGPGEFQPSWLDPAGTRLYQLVVRDTTRDATATPGPWPTELIAYDLATGTAVGRLVLPEVRAGAWQATLPGRTGPVPAQLWPGVALSPDGQRLALVHADAEAITVVDTARMVVAQTVAMTRPTGTLHRLLSHLPLAPQGASAKGEEGTARAAVFAPDGRHLYVSGLTGETGSQGELVERGLGLRAVDLASGRIEAEALGGVWVEQVLPAPDGSGVYVDYAPAVGGTAGIGSDPGWVVGRLEPATLAPLVERALPHGGDIRLWPANIGPGTAWASGGIGSASPAATPVGGSVPCPVTQPNGRAIFRDQASPYSYGNGALSAERWPDGTVVFEPGGPGFVEADGSLGMKWPWFRAVHGQLTIGGRRLDMPGPLPRGDVNPDYDDNGFQPIDPIFPSAGCWEVAGRVGGASLTFVTRVVQVGAGPDWKIAAPPAPGPTPPRRQPRPV